MNNGDIAEPSLHVDEAKKIRSTAAQWSRLSFHQMRVLTNSKSCPRGIRMMTTPGQNRPHGLKLVDLDDQMQLKE
jgi:uncharacterized protein YwbE